MTQFSACWDTTREQGRLGRERASSESTNGVGNGGRDSGRFMFIITWVQEARFWA
jgi:hypothetical protein